MDEELSFLKVPLDQLVLGAVGEGDEKLWVGDFVAVESQGDVLSAFHVGGGEGFFFEIGAVAILQIDQKDDRVVIGFFAPGDVPFVGALCEADYAFGAGETVDEILCFFVIEGGTEDVKGDGVTWGVDEFILFGVGEIEEEWVFEFSLIVGDVFECECVLQSGVVVDFGGGLHVIIGM